MKILTKYEELVGKTIALTHMAQFAENITIATEDGCVLVATQNLDEEYGERKETRVLWEPHAIRYIEENRYLREELTKLGIFDINAYKEKQAKLERERKEKFVMEQAKREREQYERLKAKFEKE